MRGGGGGERPLPPSAKGPLPRLPATKSGPRFELVDREKTCPLLLRVFTKVGEHHKALDFVVRGKESKDEVQIYTWMDAALRELTDLKKATSQAFPVGNSTTTPLLYSKAQRWSAVKFVGAVLFGVNSAIGYLLMLAIMSFNGGKHHSLKIQRKHHVDGVIVCSISSIAPRRLQINCYDDCWCREAFHAAYFTLKIDAHALEYFSLHGGLPIGFSVNEVDLGTILFGISYEDDEYVPYQYVAYRCNLVVKVV